MFHLFPCGTYFLQEIAHNIQASYKAFFYVVEIYKID